LKRKRPAGNQNRKNEASIVTFKFPLFELEFSQFYSSSISEKLFFQVQFPKNYFFKFNFRKIIFSSMISEKFFSSSISAKRSSSQPWFTR